MNNAQAALQQPAGSERRKPTGLRVLNKPASEAPLPPSVGPRCGGGGKGVDGIGRQMPRPRDGLARPFATGRRLQLSICWDHPSPWAPQGPAGRVPFFPLLEPHEPISQQNSIWNQTSQWFKKNTKTRLAFMKTLKFKIKKLICTVVGFIICPEPFSLKALILYCDFNCDFVSWLCCI